MCFLPHLLQNKTLIKAKASTITHWILWPHFPLHAHTHTRTQAYLYLRHTFHFAGQQQHRGISGSFDWLPEQPIWTQGGGHREATAPICTHLRLYLAELRASLSLPFQYNPLLRCIVSQQQLRRVCVCLAPKTQDKDQESWPWRISTTSLGWAVASRSTF